MRVRVLAPLDFGGRRYGSGEIIDIPHDSPLQPLAEIARFVQSGNLRYMPPEPSEATPPMDTASAAPLVPDRHLGGRRKAKR